NVNRTGVCPPIVPDLIVMMNNGANDKRTFDGASMHYVINTIRAITHSDSYGPTDLVMQTDHLMAYLNYTDGVAAGTPIAGGASNVLDGYYNTAMNRTTARNRGFGLMDYAPLLNRQAFGFAPARRAPRHVAQRTESLSPTTTVSLAEECLDCSMWIGAGGATDAAG